MEQSTMGTQVLYEKDIIDITKQHFYRYGQGFKQVKVTVDLVAGSKPYIGMEIKLQPLNSKSKSNDKIDKIYNSLLDSCKEVTRVEDEILGKLYSMVISGKISQNDFIDLVKKIQLK